MPLIKTGSKESIGENIRIEKHAHPDMPIKQAAAIAYSTQREAQRHDHHEREAPKHEHEMRKYGQR
jgi:hypothetical protein